MEEGQGTKDIDAEGVEPITNPPWYIPMREGKVNITKDAYLGKFIISTSLLPEQVPFEGSWIVCFPLLRMEDWDLTDHTKFPYLAMDKYMKRVYYEETCVTMLETEEWVHGVKQS